MALRSLRKIPSLKSLVARKRSRIKYADFKATHPVTSPTAVAGQKIKDKV